MVNATREIVGVTGHQNIPACVRNLLDQKLLEWFPQPEQIDVVCSFAVGADTLIAEYLSPLGAGLCAVIPCRAYESTYKTKSDLVRFKRLMQKADIVQTLEFEKPSEQAFMAAGALVVEKCDWLLAVWDGRNARGLGGTGDVVALAREQNKPVRVVWVEGAMR